MYLHGPGPAPRGAGLCRIGRIACNARFARRLRRLNEPPFTNVSGFCRALSTCIFFQALRPAIGLAVRPMDRAPLRLLLPGRMVREEQDRRRLGHRPAARRRSGRQGHGRGGLRHAEPTADRLCALISIGLPGFPANAHLSLEPPSRIDGTCKCEPRDCPGTADSCVRDLIPAQDPAPLTARRKTQPWYRPRSAGHAPQEHAARHRGGGGGGNRHPPADRGTVSRLAEARPARPQDLPPGGAAAPHPRP